MKIDNVTSAKKKQDCSIIKLIISDPLDGTTRVKRYAAIRGGISWPTPKARAYFCVVGQKYIDPPKWKDEPIQAGKLVLLAEHESKALSPEFLFQNL